MLAMHMGATNDLSSDMYPKCNPKIPCHAAEEESCPTLNVPGIAHKVHLYKFNCMDFDNAA